MSGDGSAPSTRRLAAVLIADVVGYSRLMERDEAGTHARLREIRHDVTDPAVLRHGGRIVRTVGDGLLVEFPSAMSALQAAIDIQHAMAARNAGLPAAERIDHRIGINLGDILVDAIDIAGNGVNVAARLEAIAPAGGIAISGTVYEQVRQDLGVSFVDAGEQQIKNISRPVRVYTVQFDGTPARQARPQVLPWLRRAAALVLLAIVVAAGVAYWLRNAQVGTASALIVVPFDAGSGSEPVAASLTMQLTAAVSRISGLAVIAPTIATRFNAQTIDLKKIGRELGVRYALEGRVELDANRVHVDAQLIAAESGATVWAGGFDAARPTSGEAPLEVVGRLAETVRSEYRAAELKRLGASETAQVLALRATADLGNAVDVRELRAVRATFERALQLDPAEVLAQIGLADSLAFESQRMPLGPERDALLARADTVSLRATSADPNNAEAWGTRAQVLLFRDQVEAASQAVERALSLNPYVSDLHALRAQVLMARGDAADAVAEIDRALGLNPRGNATGVLLNDRCRAQLMLGRYDAAIESCERGLAFVPDWPDYMLLTAAYALKNDMPRARAAKAELMRLQPGFTIRWHAGVSGPDRAQQLESTVYAGLRKAGVPE
ncbi:MAG: adenylate/guanylate cyclase domain-containing protein [Gemmatimonadota bacterium]